MNGKLTVKRFNPQVDPRPYLQEFEFRFEEGMSALDVLNQIYEEQDPSLGYSYCCKAEVCGMCGVMLNRKPVLLCEKPAEQTMLIEPLSNLSVKKDLIIDRDEYESRRQRLRLFLERFDKPESVPEQIDGAGYEKYKYPSRCIECYCCVSVCPAYKKNPAEFAGPCAFVLEGRHFYDPRNRLSRALIAKSEGAEKCIECGLCSKVCPVGAKPMETIQDLKAAL